MLDPIMVAVDGSHFSEQAIGYAVTLAERAGAKVNLALVHEPMPNWASTSGAGSLDQQGRAAEQAYVDALVKGLAERTSVAVSGDIISAPGATALEEHAVRQGFTTSLLNRPVAGALALHAQERRAALVVLSTHGRGAIRRLWLGSVAEQLVWQIDIPVLLIKPADESDPSLPPPPPPPFRHVLVPLDTSTASAAIIDTAMAIGRLSNARFTLLTVHQDPGAYLGTPDEINPQAMARLIQDQVAATRTYLDEVAARFVSEGLEATTLTVTADSPTAGILRVAEDQRADLIAMSTHGGGVKGMLMGSVTARVVQRAAVPILIVRPAPEQT